MTTERKSRGFPFDIGRLYKNTTVAYSNKKFNVHSEYSLMKAGTEAQDCKENKNGSDLDFTEVEEYYKVISNKKVEAKSDPFFNPNQENASEETPEKQMTSKSVPAFKCEPIIKEFERRYYRINKKKKDRPDIVKVVVGGFIGCLKWTSYAFGCYVGIGALYLGILQIPMIGPGLEYYGLGMARPLFSPMTFAFTRIVYFVGSSESVTDKAISETQQKVSTSNVSVVSGARKGWVWGFFECFFYTSEHANEDVGP